MTVQPIDFSWMHEQISAEQYDAMTEEQCRDIPLLNRQPDVVVYSADASRNRRLPVSAVVMVAEIVSPGSETTDRVVKPLEYAEAGIGHYWRVEIGQDSPVVHTHALDPGQSVYRKTGEFTGVVKAEHPFPVEIDLTDA
jgi:hypothetical protein